MMGPLTRPPMSSFMIPHDNGGGLVCSSMRFTLLREKEGRPGLRVGGSAQHTQQTIDVSMCDRAAGRTHPANSSSNKWLEGGYFLQAKNWKKRTCGIPADNIMHV